MSTLLSCLQMRRGLVGQVNHLARLLIYILYGDPKLLLLLEVPLDVVVVLNPHLLPLNAVIPSGDELFLPIRCFQTQRYCRPCWQLRLFLLRGGQGPLHDPMRSRVHLLNATLN